MPKMEPQARGVKDDGEARVWPYSSVAMIWSVTSSAGS